MTKLVNIYPSVPVISTNPPIRSIIRNVKKPVEQIRACIMARATVEEILKDGSKIRLDLTNYDKDNEPKTVKAPEPTKTVEIKPDEPVKEAAKEEPKEEIKDPAKTEPVVEEPKLEAVEEANPEIEEMVVLEDASTDAAVESSEKPVEEKKAEVAADELNETIEQIKNKYKNKKRR